MSGGRKEQTDGSARCPVRRNDGFSGGCVGLGGQVDPPTPERPYSCSLYDAEQKKCASGKL